MKTRTIILIALWIIALLSFEIWYGINFMFPYLVEFGDKHGDIAAQGMAFISFIARMLVYCFIMVVIAFLSEIKFDNEKK